jgi:hypothetical protein
MILLAAAYFFFSSPVLAEPLPSTQLLTLNQEEATLQLQTQEFETLYRTDLVPDTCYREETQGTRTECRTETEQRCDTRYEQDCRYRSYPVCQQILRPVCFPRQVCHTVMDRVCNSRGCQSVPRRVCQTQNQCQNQWDTVCHTDQRYECQNVPRTFCQDIPRQVCNPVPNVVRVPYACQRPVQVPIGQKLKLDTLARVQIRIANLREIGVRSENLTLSLNQGKVSLSASGLPLIVRILEQSQDVRRVGETQAEVDARYLIEILPLEQINGLPSIGLTQGRLESDRIEFQMKGLPAFPVKGRLQVVRKQTFGGRKTIVNSDFEAQSIVIQGGTAKLMLLPFGVECVKNRPHEISVRIFPDLEAMKKGLVNTDILSKIETGGAELHFEDRP